MRLDSLRVANLLSFGPEQHFDQFTKFNLFVGRNGSGKSNLLKLIGNLPTEIDAIRGAVTVDKAGELQAIQTYHARFPFDSHNRNRRHADYRPHRAGGGTLLLTYSHKYDINKPEEQKSIDFRNGEHISGDFTEFTRQVASIGPYNEEGNFLHQFSKLLRGNKQRLRLLNFGIYFVFRRALFFHDDGTYGEIESRARGAEITGGSWSPSDDYSILATGVFRAAQLIIRFLAAHDRSIILIDEPEDWLEPRACRQLWRFLFWLSVHEESSETRTGEEKELFDSVENVWEVWKQDLGRIGLRVEDAEEPIPFSNPKQLFVATHSSVLINEFLALRDVATIYNFEPAFLDNSHDRSATFNAILPNEKKIPANPIIKETLFSVATRVGRYNELLDSLGCHGSDLLQTNGVIWVEGPSDIIYIQKWIEMFCMENNRRTLKKGSAYEYQMYGGSLLDSLCMIVEGLEADEQKKKLVEMFSFSRNAFVIIDSDAIEKDGVVVDNSSFAAAKAFMSEQFNDLNGYGYKIGMWFDEGDTEFKTIEDYRLITDPIRPEWRSKTVHAHKVVGAWEGRTFSEFPLQLQDRIRNLVDVIDSWQPY